MRGTSTVSPVYAQIALDLALRITRGELKENSKVYGRSVMSSEYGVSPETIRRALKLLEDMNIVAIRHNSGVTILSVDSARKYVERFGEQNHVRTARQRLGELMERQDALNGQILDTLNTIVRLSERVSKANPFLNYEAEISAVSPLIGHTLAELKFWQETGATVIAIRRGEQLILSPGPYAALQAGDTLIYVGDLPSVEAVNALLLPE